MQNAEMLEQPQWTLAAQALVDGCADLRHDDERVTLLESVCHGLGESLYPALLRIIALVGQYGDYPARAALARALVHALRTGRLPAGRLGAWGASRSDAIDGGLCHARPLGPIEYLCAWYAQPRAGNEHLAMLAPPDIDRAVTALLALIDTAPDARHLYSELLLSYAADPVEGTLSRDTRHAFTTLANAWAAGSTPAEVSASFLSSLRTRAPSALGVMASAQRPDVSV